MTKHYDADPVGRALGLEGAGLLALLTKDQLHPPMVDDERMWARGQWYDGAVRHTLDAAQACDLQRGQHVLDIGCGIGGPARTLVDAYGVTVRGTSTSRRQLATAQRLNSEKKLWAKNISYELHDCQVPNRTGNFDVVWSMNMLYHVPAHMRVLHNAWSSLRDGGRLLIDDWMTTPRASAKDRKVLARHFFSERFCLREQLVEQIARAGFHIVRLFELGHIGRTHLCRHFRPAFDRFFRPEVLKRFPTWGSQMADDFASAIEATCALYSGERLTYFRIVARKE